MPLDAPKEYVEFWRLWQNGDFFACHEVLEILWHREAGAQRRFLHGLIHASVVLYQHRRGNAVGAAWQAARMQARLTEFRPTYYQLNVDALLEFVENEIAPARQRLTPAQSRQLEDLRRRLTGQGD